VSDAHGSNAAEAGCCALLLLAGMVLSIGLSVLVVWWAVAT
jgi:hypothetical protein